jgi:uncharacterized membrane protein YsdA (DUF1294 family)
MTMSVGCTVASRSFPFAFEKTESFAILGPDRAHARRHASRACDTELLLSFATSIAVLIRPN